MELFIVIVLIALNALFSLSEMSLVASKKSRLELLAQNGSERARLALELAQDPNRVLATTQIGLTVIALLSGVIVEAKLSADLLAWLNHMGVLVPSWVASVACLSAITLTSIVFGEMLPKRAAMSNPERIAQLCAPMAKRTILVLTPIIYVLSACTEFFLRLFGITAGTQDQVSAEDIETMLEAGAQSGLLAPEEKRLLDNVWRMDERKVGALMTPRNDIALLDATQSQKDILLALQKITTSRVLVCSGNPDHPLGFCKTSDLLHQVIALLGTPTATVDWSTNLESIHSIPNSLTLSEALEAFKTHHTHASLVYNEFGQVEGMLTLDDLLSGVIGQVPESDKQTLLIRANGDKWLIDGLAPISDVKSALGLTDLPHETGFQTAAGFVLMMIGPKLGRLPQEFDSFTFDRWTFEIVDIDRSAGHRIDQILVVPTSGSTNPVDTTGHADTDAKDDPPQSASD